MSIGVVLGEMLVWTHLTCATHSALSTNASWGWTIRCRLTVRVQQRLPMGVVANLQDQKTAAGDTRLQCCQGVSPEVTGWVLPAGGRHL